MLSQLAFCQPYQAIKVHYRACEVPVNDINKDVCGAKLLPITVLAYAVNCVCPCHLMEIQHCCLYLNGRYNLPLAVYPPHHRPHPSYPYPVFLDITVAVKKAVQNPVVLASQQK